MPLPASLSFLVPAPAASARALARRAGASAVLAAALAGCAAPTPQTAATALAAGTLRAEAVRPGLYRVGVADGGALVRVGTRGAVVVDPARAASHPTLLTELRRLTGRPDITIRGVVLTAAGPGVGANAASFVAAGVPVLVQRRALAFLGEIAPGATPPAVVTYDTDYQLYVDELQLEIEHVGSGRTGADSVVLFPDLRVVAVGALFTDRSPLADCASGGSLAGWTAAIDHLMWSNFELAVPARGAPVGKRELRAFRDELEAASRAGAAGPAAAGCAPAGASR
ncbi:hypothetical protein [Piscinibacter koreensis]|uniref:Metallo-beta-lactamase domain-containing protein n=1 Tax=Piscinibacter koreensis TaxID=2742824 RepID=A0A7Y6TXP5_9BURK|nr:hypothetical protein [Schlegelella koreensis]NUZ07337.1 hypothetical protein [Schlegelella koreensis]